MNRVFISIGNINIYWYSILILIALVLGYLLFKRGAKNTEIKKEVLDDMIFYMIIWAIIGARIYYVIFNLDSFTSIYDVMAIYNGGLAIYGGIIASVIFLLIYCKRKNLDFIIITDLLVPSLILGQAIGRWGNYFNIEAYGEVVSLSFLTNLHIPNFIIDSFYINGNYHHPTFFYESMGCLLGFIILLIIKRKINIHGMLTYIYLIYYGVIRFLIEGLRVDSLYLFNYRVSQLVSIIFIIIGIIGIIFSVLRRYKDEK